MNPSTVETKRPENQIPSNGSRRISATGWFKIIISLFYFVGIVGMSIPAIRPIFQQLTPFHLLLSLGVLMWFHKDWNVSFSIFCVVAGVIGFGSEVSGVHTGFPFGNYWYGPVLGVQVFEVPLMIGVNWLLLSYLAGHFFNSKIQNDILAALAAAVLMVAIDFIIEPVAMSLDFWYWEGDVVPLQNYLGWLGVAFVIQIIYRKSSFSKSNAVSDFLLLNLILFFAILNLVL
jgi:putative membrane protein